MNDHKGKKPSRLVSALTSDGTIVETIHDDAAKATGFIVARGTDVAVHTDWSQDGQRFIPVSANHNLLRHKAIRLPGKPLDYGTAQDLLHEIERYGETYVSLTPAFAGIAAAYVLLSWVYDAFNELPYLRFRGDYGSGKTRALIVYGSLMYKGFFASGASTVSPIFHTLDTFRGTLVFDEADFRFTDEKAELVKILNNGNVRGFSVLRTHVSATKEFEPRAFSVYGPKIVAMRGSYDDRALESRFLTEEMSGRALRPGVPINLPDAQEEEARILRSKLLMYRLRCRHETKVDLSFTDPALEPRMNQMLLPLLAVAPTEEIRDAIRSYAALAQAGILSDRAVSTEGQLLQLIAASLEKQNRQTLPLQEIVTAFIEKHAGDYDRPISTRFLGGILRSRLGLPLYKTNGVIALSLRDRARLGLLFARYGIAEGDRKEAA